MNLFARLRPASPVVTPDAWEELRRAMLDRWRREADETEAPLHLKRRQFEAAKREKT